MSAPSVILGISAFYHDSAAALVVDGDIVAAAQEERFSRVKHDARLPSGAIDYCLSAAGVGPDDVTALAFYEKPFLKFERLLETYQAFAPRGLRSFMTSMPPWLETKLRQRTTLRGALGESWKGRLVFTTHHEAHAASTFFPSPFEEAAILTVDGVGEWATAAIGIGRGNHIELKQELRFPHSVGLLYSAFTYYCGFKVNSGEYKLMGLAPYGRPVYADTIRTHLVDIRPDGSIALDLRYFNYAHGLTMTNPRFDALFGGPPRQPEEAISERHMDLAASIQQVTEEIVLRMARTAKAVTGLPRLCLAGGVALNCVANGVLLRSGEFEEIFVTPPSGDAGGAIGAALIARHHVEGAARVAATPDALHGSLLGPAFSGEEVRQALTAQDAVFEEHADERQLLATVAAELARGRVVGWFQGRMEFGPRALGARSILGDPRNPAMQATMNLRIKFRESFRPFAPAVLREDASSYFELESESPYMLLVAPVRRELQRTPSDDERIALQSPDLRVRVNVPRSTIPAVTHVDMSARVQTVDEARNGRFWRLLKEFKRQTGCAVLVNTSFNVRGEPIVCTPDDAYRCFRMTDMDVLVVENCVMQREAQPPLPEGARERYLESLVAD